MRRPWALLAIAGYALISALFVRDVLVAPGQVAGGDWSVPPTPEAMLRHAEAGLFLWTHEANLFGTSQGYLMLPVHALFALAGWTGIDGPLLSKILLIGALSLCGTTTFAYARHLGFARFPAFVSGLAFVTSAVAFDYTMMGWQFVLIGFGLLPLTLIAFERAIAGDGYRHALVCALLFAVAFAFASQCLVWFPLAFLLRAATIVRTRHALTRAAATIALGGVVLLLLNLAWLLPLVLQGDGLLRAAGSASNVPLGQRLSFTNLLRGWGALFNYPFASAYPERFLAFSFLPATVALGMLATRPRSGRVLFAAALLLVPFALYLFGPLVLRLPFTQVIRDVSRFLLFSALATSLLCGEALDAARTGFRGPRAGTLRRATSVAVVGAVVLGGLPWWMGAAHAEDLHGYDIRLRALEPLDGAHATDAALGAEPTSARVLYAPPGSFVSVVDDRRFLGAFKEASDVFAIYGPRPGAIFDGDRRPGAYGTFADALRSRAFIEPETDVSSLLALAGVSTVIVRHDFSRGPYSMEELTTAFERDPDLVREAQGDEIDIWRVQAPLPIVYATTTTRAIPDLSLEALVEHAPLVVSERSVLRIGGDVEAAATSPYAPGIAFREVNVARYDVDATGVNGSFHLVLGVTYSDGWTIVVRDGDALGIAEGELPRTSRWAPLDAVQPRGDELAREHFLANGFANGWTLDAPEGVSTLRLSLVYAPQALTYVGTLASLAAAALLALALWRAPSRLAAPWEAPT